MKKFRRVMSHDTEELCRFEEKSTLGSKKWHEEFGGF